jgi:hypothetical protein
VTPADLPDEPLTPWACVGCLLVLAAGAAFWGGVAWAVAWVLSGG